MMKKKTAPLDARVSTPKLNRLHPLHPARNLPQLAYDLRQATQVLPMSYQTLLRQIRKGNIGVVTDGGRKYMVAASEIQRFLTEHTRFKPTPRKGGFKRKTTTPEAANKEGQ